MARCVEAARNGDGHAFRWLVERHQDQIFSMALRLLKDRDLAAEAAQDAFVKAHRGLAQFEARSRFSTWLYRIAINVCYDRLSRKGRPGEIPLDDLLEQGFEPQAPGGAGGTEALENAEGERAFEEALEALSDTYRVPFVLRQIEERGYEEIASILGISVANAKVRVHRAREMMVAWLKDRGIL